MTTTPNFNLNYPLGADAIAVPTDLQNLATDMDTNMATMNARSVGPLLIAQDYDTTFVTEVVNTTATTNLFSLPISGAQAGEIYDLTFFGRYLNNSGSSRAFTFTASLGSATLTTGTSANFVTSTVERGFYGNIKIYVDATNRQMTYSGLSFTAAGTAANHPVAAMGLNITNVFTKATVDLSTSQNLVVSFAHSAALTTIRLRLLGYTLVRLRA